MIPREKKLAVGILVAVGAGIVYQAVNYALYQPWVSKGKEIGRLEQEEQSDSNLQDKRELAQRWKAVAARTISFERNEIEGYLSNYLASLVRQHNFVMKNPLRPGAGPAIGTGTGIQTVEFRIAASAEYRDVVAFLRELYASAFLFKITKLDIKPLPVKEGRNKVKIDEMRIETPLLPRIDGRKIPQAANAIAMDQAEPPGPARGVAVPGVAYAALSDRNVFRMFVPPPARLIKVDNQDYKTVTVTAKFFWEGQIQDETEQTVSSKATQFMVNGKGDAEEVTVRYADGKTTGPHRFDERREPWVLSVPVHSDPPPPEAVDLAVDNQHGEPIDVSVEVVGGYGRRTVKPTMRIKGRTRMDIDVYKAASVSVTATYASGKAGAQQTFFPTPSKQTLTVPPESAEMAAGPAPAAADGPADANLSVTGLVSVTGIDEAWSEAGMYATDARSRQRRFIAIGDEVDGGVLVGRHTLGGVVRMPTGNYYLYPLGYKFTERVPLETREESELASAIAAWARR